jgi:putative addiction module component (TIGR02574 family)
MGGYEGLQAELEFTRVVDVVRSRIACMKQDISDLLKKALTLPPEARAALAGSLLESLDETVEASAEEEWSREIARRITELDSGKILPLPWEAARREIAAILNGR